MFVRILRDSFFRQKRRKAIVLAAVGLGTAAAAALGDIALDVGDKVAAELRAFGANIVLLPKGGGAPVMIGGEDVSSLRQPSYLASADLPKVKDNFWKNNILAYAPALDLSVTIAGRPALLRGTWFERGASADALTGARAVNPLWSVEGRWPDDRTQDARRDGGADALVGRGLATELGLTPGQRFEVSYGGRSASFVVAGIVSRAEAEDNAVLVRIEMAQALSGARDRVSRIAVRALTTPEAAVYDRLGLDPRHMSPAEFEKWSCTPFVSSIAFELERAIPTAEARIVRRVADSEGNVLARVSGLMLFIAIMAIVGSALTVTSAFMTSVLERRSEIGLLKAMGAGTGRVVLLFAAEAAIIGVLGGLLGAGVGALLARWISASAFGSPVVIRPVAIPLAVAAALVITTAGSIVPVRRILKFRPFEVLRGN